MYRSKIMWSATGLAVPVLSAAIFIPILLGRLDGERFGVLTLAWALLSSASALDLGIGRATTQYAAALRGKGALHLIPPTVDVAWKLSILYSGIGTLLFLIAIGFDAEALIKHQIISDTELKIASLIVVAVLPIQVLTALYRGICEAFEDFKTPSLVRLFLGVVNFAGPVLVSYYSTSLIALAISLFVGRFCGMMMQYYGARIQLRPLRNVEAGKPEASREDRVRIRKQLNHFGKWMTVSNIAHPLLMQADRFIIASAISAAAVAAYYVPYEVVTQSSNIASAITSVMFPMLTARLQVSAIEGHQVFTLWRNRLLMASGSMYLILAIAFPFILNLWMADKVGPESASLGQILCLGGFFYTVSVVYTSYLHAQGRVHLCAILQIIELIVFIPAIYFATRHFGLYGAAVAWTSRTIFDALALAFVSGRGKIMTPQTGSGTQTA